MLLFDQNLSWRLINSLADVYPGSTHVRLVGLDRAVDPVLWQYAAAHDLAIVFKDSDLPDRSRRYSHPPKVIWLDVGNCPTVRIETLLRGRHADVMTFLADPAAALLTLI